MRHRKHTCKLSRTKSHRKALMSNMLKSLILEGKIETTLPKAKELRRHADKIVTLAKTNTLHTRRRAISKLMLHFNHLSSREARLAKQGDLSAYNSDRKVMGKLFDDLANRFKDRNGGYTRIIKKSFRAGDGAPLCLIEYLEAAV